MFATDPDINQAVLDINVSVYNELRYLTVDRRSKEEIRWKIFASVFR